jgi:hypothetical protein
MALHAAETLTMTLHNTTRAAQSRTALTGLLLVLLPVLGYFPLARAQSIGRADSQYGEAVGKAYAGKRLSELLLSDRYQRAADKPYFEGLIWSVPAQTREQRELKNSLLSDLYDRLGPDHPLYQLIDSRPVTSRVLLKSTDPLLMDVRPDWDPELDYNHAVTVPQRPATVRVLDARGDPCLTEHVGSRDVLDYLKACRMAGGAHTAVLWLVQPDGRTESVELGAWANKPRSVPMPGAWLWLEDKPLLRKAAMPAGFSERMVKFLATQGVSGDAPARALVVGQATAAQQFAASQQSTASQGMSSSPSSASSSSASPSGAQPSVSAPVSLPDQSSLPGTVLGYAGRDLPVSTSEFGTVGLWQSPTARMKPTGSFTFTQSVIEPYRRYNVFVQPFEWLEAGFRYTDIENREYTPGNPQSFKDKSIDFKLRLLKESAWLPQVAMGMRDLGGTGLFSGEYVVASKRHGDFDFSLGMGWGYFGKRGDVRNPLGRIASSFDQRTGGFGSAGDSGKGGELSTSTYFHGPAALFGGVQYHTPWDPLVFKLEYDSNDYKTEPLGNAFTQTSRFNYGFVYKVSNFFDIRMARERGDTTMIGFSFTADLLGPAPLKVLDKPKTPVVAKQDNKMPDWSKTAQDVNAETEWAVRSIARNGRELTLTLDKAPGFYLDSKLERAAAVINRDAPKDIDWLNFDFNDRGLGLAEQTVDRKAFVRERTEYVADADKVAVSTKPMPRSVPPDTETLFEKPPAPYTLTFTPTFQQTLGGPSGFLFYQLGVGARAEVRLTERTWWSAFAKYRLLDNYENYAAAGKDGTLPEVRSLLRDYQTNDKFNIPNLQLTHVEKLGDGHYASVYGGLLEWMFGGVGAEYLYRPFGSPLALGVDVNRVRQRGFDQQFDFRDYRATTGHATLYWDTGFEDVVAKLAVGQYLAKDRGFTLDLSRAFRNGVVMGGYFTRTNVTPEQFGEGSFDKGLYIGIPFDAVLPKSSAGYYSAGWQPLTRDGGARLQRYQQLYSITDKTGTRALFNQAVQGGAVLR